MSLSDNSMQRREKEKGSSLHLTSVAIVERIRIIKGSVATCLVSIAVLKIQKKSNEDLAPYYQNYTGIMLVFFLY